MGYVLVSYMFDKSGKKKPDFYFGGYHKKYTGMIYIATKDTAYIFDDREKATKMAHSLNKGGYKFQIEKQTAE